MDRRAVFFLGAALLCALLVPVTPDKYRWVGEWLAVTYIVLGIASFLDHISRVGLERKPKI